MSKIVCEVCGTSYPDTTVQCPICGCVRPGTAKSVASSNKDGDNGGYTYVKGGRFSKANARKRGVVVAPADQTSGGSDNRGFLIALIILLLAIIAVSCYILLKLFLPWGSGDPDKKPGVTDPVQTTVQTEAPTVPCVSLKLEVDEIILDKKGAAWMVYTKTEPADTTDKVVFSSSDESVATVSENGKVTAVGPGEAIVTVICGDKVAQCTVECTFELPTEETTEPEETTVPEEELILNRMDITFNSKDETWLIYDGSLSVTEIQWTTDNAKVATIENGKVTAVGGGMTTVYAEYKEQKVSCIIRCNFTSDDEPGVGGNGGVTEDGGGDSGTSASGTYQLKTIFGEASDITMKVGEAITLSLVDENGNKASGVTWKVADSGVCKVSNGSVTASQSGTTKVTATYNGKTYTCIVRVNEA